jgi:carbon storage regulator
MLVLSRKRNEKLLIYTDKAVIEIAIIEVRGDRVRIGIEAPVGIKIMRAELVPEKRDDHH